MKVFALAPDFDFGYAGLVKPLILVEVTAERDTGYFDGYIEGHSETLHSFRWNRCHHLNKRGDWLRMEQLP